MGLIFGFKVGFECEIYVRLNIVNWCLLFVLF